MDVRLPNGVVLKNVPEGTSKDEIRARAIRAGAATAKDFGEPSEAVAQIPKEGYPAVQSTNLIEPMSTLDYAIQGAAAVPAMAGVARGAQLLTRGSRAAPYAAELARAVIPQTGRQLAFEGALGAASGVAGGLVGEQMEPGLARELATLGAGAAVAAPFAVGRNLLDEPYPYPFKDQLPLIKFPGQRITDEPGAIFEYNPAAGKVLESIPLPGLPSYVFEHLQDLGARLRDIFGLNCIVTGKQIGRAHV